MLQTRIARATGALATTFLLAAAGGAQAQSVTLYGLIDTAVERVDNVGPAGSSLTRVPSLTGTLASRIGLRGSEDLGGGLRAVFTIEQGFAPDQGTLTQGGRGWGRQAFIGIAGSWGTFSLGRQYTMLFWSLLEADIMGPALYGTGSLDAYIPNARADNALAWRGSFSGLTLGATYSLGRDLVNAGSPAGTNCAGELAGDSKACREWSALVKYDSPNWGAALALDEIRGGPGALFGLSSSDLSDQRLSANGWFKAAGIKAAVGLVRRDNGGNAATPKSDLWWLGASWPLNDALTLDAQWHTLRIKNGGGSADLLALRAQYALSRRTAVYALAGRIDNSAGLALSVSAGAGGSNPVAGAAQGALAAGLRHAF